MASNFKVSTRKNSKNVHLRLIGDFDGISAHQLLNVLDKNCKKAEKVFIDTSTLRRIHPFGCNVFQKNLNFLRSPSGQIVFTGEYANRIAPQ